MTTRPRAGVRLAFVILSPWHKDRPLQRCTSSAKCSGENLARSKQGEETPYPSSRSVVDIRSGMFCISECELTTASGCDLTGFQSQENNPPAWRPSVQLPAQPLDDSLDTKAVPHPPATLSVLSMLAPELDAKLCTYQPLLIESREELLSSHLPYSNDTINAVNCWIELDRRTELLWGWREANQLVIETSRQSVCRGGIWPESG